MLADHSSSFIIGFGLGLVLGLGICGLLVWGLQRTQRQAQQTLRDMFANLSMEALTKSSDQFLKLADERLKAQSQAGEQALDGKKALIDEGLKALKGDLEKVQVLMTSLEKDRHQKFGELSQELKRATSQTEQLQQTTQQLKAALANTKTRGQWGERMAEDVLRLAGFVEGVNYLKQKALGTGEAGMNRPDYTFLLPQGQAVHMDVKFPLDNYLNYLNAGDDISREGFRKQFLADTRERIKEATRRGYGKGKDVLDYVLVFIPNEQVYSFLQEQDNSLLDDALRHKVILCSPTTLYAVLAVIRQAVDNFQMQQKAGEMLTILRTFKDQWDKFTEAMEKVEKKFTETHNALAELTGPRRRQLEKPLDKLEALRQNAPDDADVIPLPRQAESDQ